MNRRTALMLIGMTLLGFAIASFPQVAFAQPLLPPALTANNRADRATLDIIRRKVSEGTSDVEFQYEWQGATNRCIGAKATYRGILIGTAKALGTGGDSRSGYYVEVEEVQYGLTASHDIIYTGRLRFPIGSSGTKLLETAISGKKGYALFETWPMGPEP